MLSFLLLPLYTLLLKTADFGSVTVLFSLFAVFNVVLAYGMETSFFRFFQEKEQQAAVVSTALISLVGSTLLFLALGFWTAPSIASLLGLSTRLIHYSLGILALDALVVIPFAWMRARQMPGRYALVKGVNVALNFGANVLLLYFVPLWAAQEPESVAAFWHQPGHEVEYVFLANLWASALTLVLLLGSYTRITWQFDWSIWKRMMRYSTPVMIAGLAFVVNEVFDKILLSWLLPTDVAASELGQYAACYKLSVFMTLYATAFRLGIEPFFFSQIKAKNPQNAYALVTYYFVLIGSVLLLGVMAWAHPLKELLIRNSDYWPAMKVVPLILIGSFCLGIYHNLSVWYKVTDRTGVGALISMVAAAITILLNFWLIPTLGYMASAIATLAAYATMMFLSYFWGRKAYYIPYDLKGIGAYFFGSILLSLLVFYVLDGIPYLGYVLFFAYLAAVLLIEYRKSKTSPIHGDQTDQ